MLSRPRRVVERPRANPVLRAVVWMGNKASIDNHVGNDATVHQRAIGAAENERHQLRKRVIDAKRGILSRAGRCVANIDSRADGELNAAVSARFDAEQRSRESATNEQRMRAELAETNRSGETARAASGALQRIPRGDHAQAASIPRDELAGAKNMTTCLRGDLAAWEDQWRRRRPTPTPRMGRWAFRTKSLSRPASRSAGSAPGFRVIRRRSRSMSGAGGPGRTFRRSVKGDDDPAESWPHDLLWDQVLWVDWEGRLEVGSGESNKMDSDGWRCNSVKGRLEWPRRSQHSGRHPQEVPPVRRPNHQFQVLFGRRQVPSIPSAPSTNHGERMAVGSSQLKLPRCDRAIGRRPQQLRRLGEVRGVVLLEPSCCRGGRHLRQGQHRLPDAR